MNKKLNTSSRFIQCVYLYTCRAVTTTQLLYNRTTKIKYKHLNLFKFFFFKKNICNAQLNYKQKHFVHKGVFDLYLYCPFESKIEVVQHKRKCNFENKRKYQMSNILTAPGTETKSEITICPKN